jgi:hypothetical protein
VSTWIGVVILAAPFIVPLLCAVVMDVHTALMDRKARRCRARPLLPGALDLYIRQRARKNEVMRQMRAVVRDYRNHPR